MIPNPRTRGRAFAGCAIAALAVSLLGAVSPAPAHAGTTRAQGIAPTQPPSDAVTELLADFNAERAARNVPQLTEDPRLSFGSSDNTETGTVGTYSAPFSPSAQDWANHDSAADDRVATDPGGAANPYPPNIPSTYTGINGIDDAGGSPGLTSGDLFRGLIESTGHRTNMMSQNIEAVGIGISCDDHGWMHVSVAVAGTYAEVNGSEAQTSPVPVTPAHSGYACPAMSSTAPASAPGSTTVARSSTLPSAAHPVLLAPHGSLATAGGYALVRIQILSAKSSRTREHRISGTVTLSRGGHQVAVLHTHSGYLVVRLFPGAYGITIAGADHHHVHVHFDAHGGRQSLLSPRA